MLTEQERVEQVFADNLGLAHRQLHKFYLIEDPDAISLAYEALYNAILTFDKSKSNKFSTYATVCIYNRLGSYIRSNNIQSQLDIVYYETPVGDTGLTMKDKLPGGTAADTACIDECGVTIVRKKIDQCLLETKNKTHRSILDAWIASEFKRTHMSIANSVGVTQTYVSQVIKKFRLKLKQKLEEDANGF